MKMRIVTAILLLAVMVLAACTKKPEPVKRYALAGRVVSVSGSEVTVDHKAIPGFMDAMTMAYKVKDTAALKSLVPGDEITADVVMQGTKIWLENVRLTKKNSGANSTRPRLSSIGHGEEMKSMNATG